ncbi:RdgB/HAM1 family non-canonical purine NTP pyrophosphatase [Novosphingobium sp. fls2-241-R2A-195]|uniref:RdgB/HAM1 family non-canonical purine NTP pyrophosphatase n=1 Tax=Novosphingobium sp. fls2-241-R2A-195 TaxID=3040296 RepID=UPI00254C5519|nr:RdgB/HAM1 family non-canonical purine NTP pyrophosphatase [Novosphingobium sp. fls2-241-R2A-195]
MTRKLDGSKLVIATHNAGKLREISALLAPFGVDCVSAGDLSLPEPEETGTTFVENALLKAHAAAKAAGLPALADDSGLSVTALGGRPGVYTADWAERQWFEGEPGKDYKGRDWYMAMGKVEGLLSQQGPDVDRSCWFTSILAIAWPEGDEAIYEGRVTGTFSWPPRGTMGFGYDPVFVPEGRDVSFAELTVAEKQTISHRADAFAKLVADQFPDQSTA